MVSGSFIEDLDNKKKKIAVVGLGYVGIPLLVKLGEHFSIIGFDISEKKIEDIIKRENVEDFPELADINGENVDLTSDENRLSEASFYIITVPTPIDKNNNPDLEPILGATGIVGRNMPERSIIVYESTVFPGLTEEICVPLLEEESGFNRSSFFVGYSPERINPGDKIHTLDSIVKIISAQDEKTLSVLEEVYSRIIKAGVYKAESIKIAESAKVIENIQRDINIALVNELAMLFKKMGIDSSKVLEAACTKWNFLDFKPGLVGGHCIGVDPFYLTYKANEMGYYPEIILAGRRINDNMGNYIGSEIIKNVLIKNDINGKLRVILFGITFKENVKDIRNSKIFDLYNHLKQFGMDVSVYDPVADRDEVRSEYGIELLQDYRAEDVDAAVFCVSHDSFKNIDLKNIQPKPGNSLFIFDIKGIFKKNDLEQSGYNYWRL
jgi:UDP-N-acetyl-D-glucosamine/UDP-N-acetyl-D-galactosamine dehydrogenase